MPCVVSCREKMPCETSSKKHAVRLPAADKRKSAPEKMPCGSCLFSRSCGPCRCGALVFFVCPVLLLVLIACRCFGRCVPSRSCGSSLLRALVGGVCGTILRAMSAQRVGGRRLSRAAVGLACVPSPALCLHCAPGELVCLPSRCGRPCRFVPGLLV